MVQLSQIHDRYFKWHMSRRRVARAFMKRWLPAHVLKKIDLSRLELARENFVSKWLGLKLNDVFYKVYYRDSKRYIYVLIEHQSTVDSRINRRLFGYFCGLYHYHIEQQGEDSMPVVAFMLYYQGKRPHSVPLNLFDLFGDQSELGRRLFMGPILIDLQRTSDEVLLEKSELAFLAYVQKQVYSPGLIDLVRSFVQQRLTGETEDAKRVIIAISSYLTALTGNQEVFGMLSDIAQYDNRPVNHSRVFKQVLRRLALDVGLKEGMERGETVGRAKGIAEGRVEGERLALLKVARRLLQEGVTQVQVAKLTGLSVSDIAQVELLFTEA